MRSRRDIYLQQIKSTYKTEELKCFFHEEK